MPLIAKAEAETAARYRYPFHTNSFGFSLNFYGVPKEIQNSFSIGTHRDSIDLETGVDSGGYAFVSLTANSGERTTFEFENNSVVWIQSYENLEPSRMYQTTPSEVSNATLSINSSFDENLIQEGDPIEILEDQYGLDFRNYSTLIVTEPFDPCFNCPEDDCGPHIYTIGFDKKRYTVATVKKRKRPGFEHGDYVATRTLAGSRLRAHKVKRGYRSFQSVKTPHRCAKQKQLGIPRTGVVLNNFDLKYRPSFANRFLSALVIEEVPMRFAHKFRMGMKRQEIDSLLGFPTLDYAIIQFMNTNGRRDYALQLRIRNGEVVWIECGSSGLLYSPYYSREGGTVYSDFRTLQETVPGELSISGFPDFKLETGMKRSEISEKLGFDTSKYSKLIFTKIESGAFWGVCGEELHSPDLYHRLLVEFEDNKAVCKTTQN